MAFTNRTEDTHFLSWKSLAAFERKLAKTSTWCGTKTGQVQSEYREEFNRKFPKGSHAVLYKKRNKTGRFFGRHKTSFCRVETRQKKTSCSYMVTIKPASERLWIKFYVSAA